MKIPSGSTSTTVLQQSIDQGDGRVQKPTIAHDSNRQEAASLRRRCWGHGGVEWRGEDSYYLRQKQLPPPAPHPTSGLIDASPQHGDDLRRLRGECAQPIPPLPNPYSLLFFDLENSARQYEGIFPTRAGCHTESYRSMLSGVSCSPTFILQTTPPP